MSVAAWSVVIGVLALLVALAELPEFAVPIECRKDKERWQLLEVLPPPPQPAPPQDWSLVYRPDDPMP